MGFKPEPSLNQGDALPMRYISPFQAALVPHQHEEGLGAAHQALLQREGPTGFQSFTKPPCFGARIAGLLGLMVRIFFLD